MTVVFDALRTTPSAFGNEKHVIASQCAIRIIVWLPPATIMFLIRCAEHHWRGNPLWFLEYLGDRHTSVSTGSR